LTSGPPELTVRPLVTPGLVSRILSRLPLRFPALFVILLTVTVADLLIPDAIPFVDEIVLGLLTTLFGLWHRRRESGGPVEDGIPRRGGGPG
jgi:Family of unknown function (DUF6116)